MTANRHTATVGFIGLGDQGAPIARAISEAGFELHAWARKARSLDALHDLGDSAADFTNRAVLGAKALPELAARIH